MASRSLGRRQPADDEHIRKYSLAAPFMPLMPTPVVLGINWYESFDTPAYNRSGRYYILRSGSLLGKIRGGHAICLLPPKLHDEPDWWTFYDQGEEGACVGFATARMMTLLNRRRYDAERLYLDGKKVDEWPGEDYDGTSVRAVLDVVRDYGLFRVVGGKASGPHWSDGVSANRWATSVDEVAWCLDPATEGKQVLNAGYVTFLNSWGRSYPHLVRLPLDTLNRLLNEDGEATVVTDR